MMQRRQMLVEIAAVGATFRFAQATNEAVQAEGVSVRRVANFGGLLGASEIKTALDVDWPIRRTMQIVHDLRAAVSLAWFLHSTRPSVIRLHTPKAGVIGALVTAATRQDFTVFQLHGFLSDSVHTIALRMGRLSEWIVCRLVDEIWPVGKWMIPRLAAKGRGIREKVLLIGEGSAGGVDVEGRFNPASYSADARTHARQRLQIPSHGFVIGFVGRLGVEKGERELRDAWQKLRELAPEAFLLIVGSAEPRYRESDSAEVAFHGDPRVRTTGWVQNAAEYYSIMDVLVHPTWREGLPYAVLEACAMEVPVVTSDVPGCVEALDGGREFGRIVGVGDVEQLVRSIAEYRRDPDLRRREGIRARESVCRRYAQSCVAELQARRIEALLERERRPII